MPSSFEALYEPPSSSESELPASAASSVESSSGIGLERSRSSAEANLNKAFTAIPSQATAVADLRQPQVSPLRNGSASMTSGLCSSHTGGPLHIAGAEERLNRLGSLTLPRPKTLSAALSPSKSQRRVTFADEEGGRLCQVRVMSEPGLLAPRLYSGVERTSKAFLLLPQWRLDFTPPVQSFQDFVSRLRRVGVSLETAAVEMEDSPVLAGTAKVLNRTFRKDVFLRVSLDGWLSHHDHPGRYLQGLADSDFDTFAFAVSLPTAKVGQRRVEFALCFQEPDLGTEAWDNNAGANYALSVVLRRSPVVQSSKPGPSGSSSGPSGRRASARPTFRFHYEEDDDN